MIGYIKETAVGSDTPNWLASEVGLTYDTAQLKKADYSADENGVILVKSGSVVKANGTVVGLLVNDTDLTHGDRAVGIIKAGRVYENRLTVGDSKSALQGLGIHFENMPETTRE